MSRVYIGNLPNDVQVQEVEDIFSKYGKFRSCDLKGGRDGTARFAFIDFEDPRDADDATRGENGQDFAGGRLRVRHGQCVAAVCLIVCDLVPD
jgi:splicing factor, arginine/serine-rich 1